MQRLTAVRQLPTVQWTLRFTSLQQGGSIKDLDGAAENEKYVWVPFEKVDASNVRNYQ